MAAKHLAGKMKIVIAGPGRGSKWAWRMAVETPGIFEVHNRYLSDSEVARLFQRASVCVLPYQQAPQSSIPLISAAFGVPVVATSVGAFVQDVPRVNGILVPPDDVEVLTATIMGARERKPYYNDLNFDVLGGQFIKSLSLRNAT